MHCLGLSIQLLLIFWVSAFPLHNWKERFSDKSIVSFVGLWIYIYHIYIWWFSHSWLMSRFIIQDKDFLLWTEPQVQSESTWFLHIHHVTRSQLSIFCLVNWYFNSQLFETDDDFSLRGACLAHPSTMKGRKKEGKLYFSSNLHLYIYDQGIWHVKEWDLITYFYRATTSNKKIMYYFRNTWNLTVLDSFMLTWQKVFWEKGISNKRMPP